MVLPGWEDILVLVAVSSNEPEGVFSLGFVRKSWIPTEGMLRRGSKRKAM